MACLALFTIVASTPAHAVEGLAARATGPVALASIVMPLQKLTANIHALPGHACATHCTLHGIALGPLTGVLQPPPAALAPWTTTAAHALAPTLTDRLKRPPRS